MFLGENYYTDRTSKQTVDVLRRRDKTLQSQIHSLKAEIDDFQTEASFFSNTASEVAVCFLFVVFILFLILHMHLKWCCHSLIGRTS